MSNFTTPSSSDFGGNVEIILFENGKPVEATNSEVHDGAITVNINIYGSNASRAAQYSAPAEVDDGSSMWSSPKAAEDAPCVLYTRSSDSPVNRRPNQAKQSDDGPSCNATNVAPEEPSFDQECLGKPNQATILTPEEINLLIEDKAEEVRSAIYAYLRDNTIPLLQSGAAKECFFALADGRSELDEAVRILHLSDNKVVEYYLRSWRKR